MENIPIILTIGFSIIGFFITIVGVLNLRIALKSSQWPFVEGEITHSGTKTVAGGSIFVMPEIHYKFHVKDIKYTGNCIAIIDLGDTSGKTAKNIISKYRVGDTTPVYYHPQHTERCFLEPGIHKMTLAPFLVGVLFLVSVPAILFFSKWIDSMN